MRVRPRVKAIALATEHAAVSPLLPLAAALIITLFAISLAMAEPRNDTAVLASHDIGTDFDLGAPGGLASDALPAHDPLMASRSLHSPRYPDRYQFYHRYDHGLISRSSSTDDAR